ncbi:cupin domain-containing protein [Spirillospora sp. NPDC047279]|uniref:JmjC domain-containing protein n=1 Tax=Spirillospora sp. NPDC047279 TaxID=3155478 RepID=UPI0033C523C7
MSETMTAPLPRLAHDVAELAACWEERPLLSRGLGPFDDVFSLARMESVLASAPLVESFVRLMRDGDQPDPGTVTRARERGGPRAERLVDPAKVAGELRRGTTILLEEVRTCCPEVAAFTRGVEAATGYATYAAAFLTPPGAQGAAPHYDLASVFIRQLHGSKRWRIGRPAEPWPTEPWNNRPVPLDDEVEHLLEEGDCLYLPRGYVHVGEATGAASLHLSIAVKPVTWEQVLVRRIAELAAREPALRQALPFAFHHEPDDAMAALLASRAELVREHLGDLPCERVWKSVRDEHAPRRRVPPGELASDLRDALEEGGAS